MNTDTESKHSLEPANLPFSRRVTVSMATRFGVGILAAGLLLAGPCARAQTNLSTPDHAFLLAAAQGGMTEVKLGELAAQKGTREDVKAFGQSMVKDHSAINADLKTLAAQKGVPLPEALDADHQAMVDKMAALTGSDFDDAYITDMIKGHKQVARSFKAESAKTQDADIKSFLEKTIPVVGEHLKRVAAMKK